MKDCGVVTDKSWYDATHEELKKENPKVKFIRTETMFLLGGYPRIYSDEVEMAEKGRIEFIKSGRRSVLYD